MNYYNSHINATVSMGFSSNGVMGQGFGTWGPFRDTPPGSPRSPSTPAAAPVPAPVHVPAPGIRYRCLQCRKKLDTRRTKASNIKNPDREYVACEEGHSLWMLWTDSCAKCDSCGNLNEVRVSRTARNPDRPFLKCGVCENFQWIDPIASK